MNPKIYKDKQWLYDQYITGNKSSIKIANEVGVSKRTILLSLKKFAIEKPKGDIFPDRIDPNSKQRTIVLIKCFGCGKDSEKTQAYIERRKKVGSSSFYCSRECADKAHSIRMTDSNNPNYGGTWHGGRPSSSAMVEIGRRTSERMIREGTSKGIRNGRWAGGKQAHDCIVCGKTSEYSPHIHRKIVAGNYSPCCSNQCSTAVSRRSQEWLRTSIEVEMADELTRRGVEFIEQYNLADKFILDFLLPEHRIVIECDGDYWHRRPDVVARDKRKNAYIGACGFPLFRFWECDIHNDVEACVDVVMTRIKRK